MSECTAVITFIIGDHQDEICTRVNLPRTVLRAKIDEGLRQDCSCGDQNARDALIRDIKPGLDHFVVFGHKHMDMLCSSYRDHDHLDQPHQGKDNELLVTA